MPTQARGPVPALEITGLAYDSRQVRSGTLFFCIPGAQHDGHDFAAQAIGAGAAALVVERPLELDVPQIQVPSVRAAMAALAARFYGDPSQRLRVVGVTGTNGKTTTAYIVRALIEAGGEQCGLLGTVKSVIAGAERPAVRTTPEAIELQRDLRAMLDGGDQACAIEVSSHALALGRSSHIHFAAAIFTNLTQDHLDFHQDMEDYFAAKRTLFLPDQPGRPPALSVINIDDPYGRRLAGELERPLSVAIDSDADYRARLLEIGHEQTQIELDTPDCKERLTLALPGRFNVYNALGALAAVHGSGADIQPLLAALEQGVSVPGRMEAVREGQDFTVLVDYAHTPDSLANVLAAARELTHRRVILVFGAGGDRDRGKRPLMGQIAARDADLAIVTSDNPRSEDPEAIIAEIMAGMPPVTRPPGAPVQAITDRRGAIERAVELAGPGDVLVIAGKGHEQGQELAGAVKLPFDDVSVVREALHGSQTQQNRAPA
jgi:UDP-N-acetylmuramoyl-L-alanyl-D-glutamate--2,6-diaminopimelate ligase